MKGRLLAWGVALFGLLFARVASACPACAGRDDGGARLLLVYAAMVAAPFLAAYVVVRIIRRMTEASL